MKAFVKNYTLQDNDLVLDNPERQYVLRVRDMSTEDKPREKLIKFGPEPLSSNELLAIILNVGTKKEDVMNMVSRIFKEYGDKNLINQTNPKVLEKELGIPLIKACQIVACFALGKRFFQKENKTSATIRTAKEVYNYLKDMRDLPKEHLRGIYLNSRYKVIHDEVISIGTLTSNIVHPREVFKPALEYSATAVILAHNHPSGSTKPSTDDILVTKQLIETGKILGVELLDHIIITKNSFASIKADYHD